MKRHDNSSGGRRPIVVKYHPRRPVYRPSERVARLQMYGVSMTGVAGASAIAFVYCLHGCEFKPTPLVQLALVVTLLCIGATYCITKAACSILDQEKKSHAAKYAKHPNTPFFEEITA